MASDSLEGFHEVNLASPTTPDLRTESEARHLKQPGAAAILYRTHPSVSSSPGPPNTLDATQLPTQPVYSTPRHLSNNEAFNGSVLAVDAQIAVPCSSSSSRHHVSQNEPARLEADFLDDGLGDRGGEESGDVFGLSTDSLSHLRSPSVMEVREKGYERLKEELTKAQRDLKLKDEECERLSKVRDQLGQELEELTASLFEEAHKMVREANIKQATAEKQLKEAQGKIDVLQAEVAALKTLVLSTSPTSPCKDLSLGGKTQFKKGHSRNKSTSSAMLGSQQELSMMQPIVRDCREVDLLLFSEFKAWKEEPTLERTCSFLERIYKEDIYPCLTFSKSELATAILEAVENNTLSVEPVGFQSLPVVKAAAVECGGPKSLQCATSLLTSATSIKDW
ncbi:rab-3A-interacting protein-like isoform X2 [Polyodon spathula]|uniref:rab-3A-interacting protein-like isoform X2 n=1 Tax=Polyodon spathula TaxID=7913 RepID=UPI001B7F3141|nr:rab-3A-interacting protein-like isoform X2 [Polyodon spathula]